MSNPMTQFPILAKLCLRVCQESGSQKTGSTFQAVPGKAHPEPFWAMLSSAMDIGLNWESPKVPSFSKHCDLPNEGGKGRLTSRTQMGILVLLTPEIDPSCVLQHRIPQV